MMRADVTPRQRDAVLSTMQVREPPGQAALAHFVMKLLLAAP